MIEGRATIQEGRASVWPWVLAAIICGFFWLGAITTPAKPGVIAALTKGAAGLSFLVAFGSGVMGLLGSRAVLGRTGLRKQARWHLAILVLVGFVFGIWLMGIAAREPVKTVAANSSSSRPAAVVPKRVGPESNLVPRSVSSKAQIVGRWILPLDPDVSQLITIQKTKDRYEVLIRWKSGQHFTKQLHPGNAAQRFDVVGDEADTHYMLLKNGDLDVRDKDGEFLVAKRFDGNADDPASVASAMEAIWKQASCASDADCMGEPYRLEILEICPTFIEHQARYTFRWTDHWYDGKFAPGETWHGKDGKTRGLIDYIGDKIELQNGFGAWQNYIYICTFDINRRDLVDVELRPGRLFD